MKPLPNVADAVPALAIDTLHVQLLPAVVVPPTLFDLVTVMSGASVVTVLAQLLFALLASATTLLGSTLQMPPPRGFAYDWAAVPVALNVTVIEPPAGMLTVPEAVQARFEVEIEQSVVPVTPPADITLTAP